MTFLCEFDKVAAPLSNGCLPSFSYQKHSVGRFILQRSVDLIRVCYLYIISRNHSNALLLISLQ